MCPTSSPFAEPREPGAGLLLRWMRDPARPGATRLVLSGELSLATADQAREAVESSLHDAPDLVCDLAELTFIDVSGMCVLVDLAARARNRGRQLTVENPPPVVGAVLRAFGLDDEATIGSDAPPVTPTAPDRSAACNATTRPRRGRSAPAGRAARRAGY